MHYFTRQLTARRPFVYFGRELQAGEGFGATESDAEYLVRKGDAAEPASSTPAPAPTPARTPAPPAKPSDGLTVAEIKAALAEKSIDIPDGVTLKADLAALLDATAA